MIKLSRLYAFSTENWKRPIKEVEGLIKAFFSINFKRIKKNSFE